MGLCDVLKLYNAFTQSCIMYICNTCRKMVSSSVKSVNKADTNIINQPLIDCTSNVTIDLGNNVQLETMC